MELKSAASFENVTCVAANDLGEQKQTFIIVEKKDEKDVNGSNNINNKLVTVVACAICVLKFAF